MGDCVQSFQDFYRVGAGSTGLAFDTISNSSPAKCAIHFLSKNPFGTPFPSISNCTRTGVIAEHRA